MQDEPNIMLVILCLLLLGAWYLYRAIVSISKRFDALDEQLDNLRLYLYEIDPQFDHERHLLEELESGGLMSGALHLRHTEERRRAGKRTLNRTFFNEDLETYMRDRHIERHANKEQSD